MEKLYDKDSYIAEFEATVKSCEKADNGFWVALDKTAFFPTAGGQECDTGTLGGERVLDVIIKNEIIYHLVKKPIEGVVIGKIDWSERYRKMQHHSAEHIVSGIVNKKFGYNNVGFHLSDSEVVMDYDGEMLKSELDEVELLANEAVFKNVSINAYYPKGEELSTMNYRSKLDLTENVRIVEIDGIDRCACCAPHVKRTGEIGIIKLKDMMRHRGGVRIRMICAADALSDYRILQKNAEKVSGLLSVKQNETAIATEKLLSDVDVYKQKISELSKKIAKMRADAILPTNKNLCLFDDGNDMNALRILVNEASKKCDGMCIGLSGSDEAGYNYIISGKSLRKRAKEINEALSGRGGGNDDMIQGHFNANAERIQKYFEEFK